VPLPLPLPEDVPAAPAVEVADRTQVIRPAQPSEPPLVEAAVQAAPPPPPRPPAAAPQPVRPAQGRDHRLPILLGLLALALVGVLVAALLNRHAQQTGQQGSPQKSPQASAKAAAPASSQKASPPANPGSSSGSSGSTAVPAGFVKYTDAVAGFSVAVPAGWQRANRIGSIRDGQVDFLDPHSGRYLRFGYTTRPKDDAVADWEQQEKRFKAKHPDYQKISIQKVTYRTYEAADWDFRLGGTRVRDRGFKVDSSHGYAIYLSAPESQWSDSLKYFETAASSFQPAA
jgi:hypothetical protein